MENDKANVRTGHLMASSHRRPRHHKTPEEEMRCLFVEATVVLSIATRGNYF